MQLELFNNTGKDNILEDLFQAYFDARKNKRNTINALAFEKKFETELFSLYDDIISRRYKILPGICFIVDKPVKREVFAANFRDRVIHHLIYNYISPIFDKIFINDSYSCRIGKGTHYGINRIDRFIRSCSHNYSEDCYILKLDIKGYFMSMNRSLLYSKVMKTLMDNQHKIDFDFNLTEYLINLTIYNDPIKNCKIKGRKSDWNDLPRNKSLFYSKKNCGLPIGNLTSQLFGNVYLNDLDHFIKKELKIKYYGRYVDDFVIIHKDKEYLKSIIIRIKDFLEKSLKLELHPKKIYLQHFSKGVKYLGAVIMPHRKYIANRTKGNFYDAIANQSAIAQDHKPSKDEKENLISSLNSYLGIMQHYKTYHLRKKMIIDNLNCRWWKYVFLDGRIKKFVLK